MELALPKLVALDLKHSLLKQVWKGYKEVTSLKFLNLSYSLLLHQTPDFRGLPQLERLILNGCTNLVKVCKTIGILKGLVLLDLRDCISLTYLPALPESIITLELSGCGLREFARELKTVDCYSIMNFASLRIPTGLIKLLACLPQFLVKLNLKDCNLSDECFPMEFSRLSSLENLDLSGNLITKLPDCVRNLSNSSLHTLCISDCPQLQSVIHPPHTVRGLRLSGNRQLEKIKARVNLGDLIASIDEHTEYVEMEGCFKLVEGWNVERKVIKNLGLEAVPIGCVGKVQYEYGIFSTFVRSTRVPCCFNTSFSIYSDIGGEESEEVPRLINYPFGKMRASKIPYTVPGSSVGNSTKIQGLNICFVIRLDLDRDSIYFLEGYFEIKVTVGNKTKDLAWTYKFHHRLEEALVMEKYKEPEGPLFKKFLWVSTWKCADLLGGW